MEQRKSNAVDETKGTSDNCYQGNSVNPFDNEETALDHKKDIQLTLGHDIQETTRKVKQMQQFKSEGEFDVFPIVPSVNVVTYDKQTQNARVESTLVLKIDQAVVKCLQQLIDQVVHEYEIGVESLISLRTFQKSNKQEASKTSPNNSQLPTISRGMDEQSNLENLSGPSSQEIILIHPGKKLKVGNSSESSIIKRQQIQFQNDFDLLSSLIDEIGRMNGFYRKDVINKSKEVREVYENKMHVHENLSVLDDIPSCIIYTKDEMGETYAMLNVFDYGTELLLDLEFLLAKMSEFISEYNTFRLKFHGWSEALVSLPLERFIGSKLNRGIERVLETSRKIYKEFFNDQIFDFEFEKLKEQHKELIILVVKFNNYIDMLAEQQ